MCSLCVQQKKEKEKKEERAISSDDRELKRKLLFEIDTLTIWQDIHFLSSNNKPLPWLWRNDWVIYLLVIALINFYLFLKKNCIKKWLWNKFRHKLKACLIFYLWMEIKCVNEWKKYY